jgi:hypothetical protein
VDGVVVTLRALSVAASYALPYLITFVFLLGGVVGFSYGGYRGLRRLLRGRGPDDGQGGRPGEAALAPEEPAGAEPDAETGDGDSSEAADDPGADPGDEAADADAETDGDEDGGGDGADDRE